MNYFIYFTSFFALLQPLFFFWRIAQPTPSPSYTFYSTGETHFITSHITFNTKNVIYMVQCNRCHICCRPDWLGFRDFASPFSICSYERVGWLGSWDLSSWVPEMHLIWPSKFCITICFSFLLGMTAVPRETENNAPNQKNAASIRG